MPISFTGNIYALGNTYSIKKQNGEEVSKGKTPYAEDISINTDQVAYMKHVCGSRGAELHMSNGDVITLKPPFNARIYQIAQQLEPPQTIGYNADETISIKNFDLEMGKETFDIKEV